MTDKNTTINPEDYEVDPDDPAEIQRGLELLQKEKDRKRKIATGEIRGGQKWSELSDEQKASRLMASRRRNAALMVFKQRAEAEGITVSEDEITAYIEANSKA